MDVYHVVVGVDTKSVAPWTIELKIRSREPRSVEMLAICGGGLVMIIAASEVKLSAVRTVPVV